MSRHRFEATTRDIKIAVEPDFLDDQSDPEEHRFLWSYRVTIENKSEISVQLLSRYWRITDDRGRVREVRGEGEAVVFARSGTVGSQPLPVHWGGDCSATYDRIDS